MAVLEISKGSKNKVGLAQKVRAGYLVSVQFLRECKIELKKVKWPTKKRVDLHDKCCHNTSFGACSLFGHSGFWPDQDHKAGYRVRGFGKEVVYSSYLFWF